MAKNFPTVKTHFGEMSLADVMYCVFGLKSFEIDTYLKVIEKASVTVNELVKTVEKDRSTVQRALQSLMAVGLVYKEQKNIKNGGYYYVYHAVPFGEVKDTMKGSVTKWCDSVIQRIDELSL